MMLEQEVKRGSLWCEDGSSQGGMVAADVVLTTKSLAAQRGNSEIFRLPLQLLSVLPPRGEEGIELELLESALQSDGSRRQNSERARLLLQAHTRKARDEWWRALRLAISNAGIIAGFAASMGVQQDSPNRLAPQDSADLPPPPSVSAAMLLNAQFVAHERGERRAVNPFKTNQDQGSLLGHRDEGDGVGPRRQVREPRSLSKQDLIAPEQHAIDGQGPSNWARAHGYDAETPPWQGALTRSTLDAADHSRSTPPARTPEQVTRNGHGFTQSPPVTPPEASAAGGLHTSPSRIQVDKSESIKPRRVGTPGLVRRTPSPSHTLRRQGQNREAWEREWEVKRDHCMDTKSIPRLALRHQGSGEGGYVAQSEPGAQAPARVSDTDRQPQPELRGERRREEGREWRSADPVPAPLSGGQGKARQQQRKPGELPQGWVQEWSRTKLRHYYRHLASGTSCWTLPAPVAPPPISMTPPDSPRSPTRRQPSATPPSQVGLGLVLQQIEGDPSGGGRVRVDRLIAGGGAALSGQVEEGDQVVSINHKDVRGFELASLLSLIRGAEGTTCVLGLKKKDTGARQECEVLRVATPQTVFPGADSRHVSERADGKDAGGPSRVWRVSEMADKVRQNLARLGLPSSEPGAAAQLVAPASHFKSLSDVLGADDALPPPQPILHPADLPAAAFVDTRVALQRQTEIDGQLEALVALPVPPDSYIGMIKDENGCYTGALKGNDKHGVGVMMFETGEEYFGSWQYNCRHGVGTMLIGSAPQTERGSAVPSSFPSLDDTNPPANLGAKMTQARYRGEWKHDQVSGFGTMSYPNGCEYVGEFVHNQRCGYGIFSARNGDRYEGEWQADRKHGFGRLVYAEPRQGEHRDTSVHTHNGQATFAAGSLSQLRFVEGFWDKDQAQGKGKATMVDGSVVTGLLRQGPGGIFVIPDTASFAIAQPPSTSSSLPSLPLHGALKQTSTPPQSPPPLPARPADQAGTNLPPDFFDRYHTSYPSPGLYHGIVETYKSARDQGDPQARGGTAQEAGSGNGGEHLTPPGASNTAARQAMPATSAVTQSSPSAAAKETDAPPPYQEAKLEHKPTLISSFLRGKLGDFGKNRSLSRSIQRHQA